MRSQIVPVALPLCPLPPWGFTTSQHLSDAFGAVQFLNVELSIRNPALPRHQPQAQNDQQDPDSDTTFSTESFSESGTKSGDNLGTDLVLRSNLKLQQIHPCYKTF